MRHDYPAPGHSEVKMYYKYGGSHLGTMIDTNRYARMYRTDKLEFVVNQSIWMEGEAKFADVILPACTNFERWDISEFANCGGYVHHAQTQCNHRVIVMQHKCIEPLGESRSDYQIFLDLAKRLGLGAVFSEGMTELDWVRRLFDATDLPDAVSWKEFAKKGYYVVPAPVGGAARPGVVPLVRRGPGQGHARAAAPARRLHREVPPRAADPVGQARVRVVQPQALRRRRPRAPAHPEVRARRGKGRTRPSCSRSSPLQLISPHPSFTFHTMSDGKDSTINDVKDHRVLIDGYYYWIVRLNPADAAARGIGQHDLVKVFNDRGAVICAAQLTERVRPGTVHSYESCATYDPIGEPGNSPDRGGCINLLTPSRMMIEKSHAMAANSCLVEVAPWEDAG